VGCVDEIIAEPEGGAHTDQEAGAGLLGRALQKHLADLKAMPVDAMITARQEKFRKIAQFYTEG
jgi:acetyl-CoA carboxylase carboxyl transferase subunit alpha